MTTLVDWSAVRGVLHVGANIGQERDFYATYHLPVVWVEPIPSVFETLQENLKPYPQQTAVCALVTDTDGKPHTLNIASNHGASSSIFPMKDHTKMWRRVYNIDSIRLYSVTLPSLIRAYRFKVQDFALVVDVQGAELLVLRGAEPILSQFKYVQTEAADFESYAGGCQVNDIITYLAGQGFAEVGRTVFNHKSDVGTYYDLVFQRI